MIYLIGGASRAGKTLIAHEIMNRRQIPYLSLDWLVMGFNNGIPEYGIHHLLLPNEIAEKLWGFLHAMCESMLWTKEDHVIEGEAMMPEQVAALMQAYPDQVRACFVGYTDIDPAEKMALIKQHSSGDRDWLCVEPDPYIEDHIQNMIKHSQLIKAACTDSPIRYVDTSAHFTETIEHAIDYLLADDAP